MLPTADRRLHYYAVSTDRIPATMPKIDRRQLDHQAPTNQQRSRFPSSAATKRQVADSGAPRRALLAERLDLTRI
jgi:hypothetical protein